MSGDVITVINRRTATEAVRAEACLAGLDADRLLDSAKFYSQVTALEPDNPAFSSQVRDLVATAGQPPAGPAQGSAPPAGTQPPAGGPAQWTTADVQRSSAREVTTAMAAGLLHDLGFGTGRRARR
jgi:hypothetical protein